MKPFILAITEPLLSLGVSDVSCYCSRRCFEKRFREEETHM